MQVTVELSDEGVRAATLKALGDVFATGDQYGERQGTGYKAVRARVDEWVKAQDFAPIIAEIAPGVVREVVRDSLVEAIRKAATAEFKRLQASGELASLVRSFWQQP